METLSSSALERTTRLHDAAPHVPGHRQGGAREVIIISCCVHNETQLSSLVNLSEEGVDRKLNVALTRARKHLIMLGNADVLSKDERYRAFIERYRVDF